MSDTPSSKAAGRLSLGSKLAFGAGDLSPGIAATIIGFSQALFLTTAAGLSPGAVALILLITRVWDAIIDPWVGVLSDRTRSRFGRRRSWMLYGAVPFGIVYCLLWWAPPLGATGLFFYYLALTMAFNTVFTAVNVPYASLTGELTDDYDERTSLNSYRFSFSILGSLAAGILHGILVTRFCADPKACLPAESRTGYLLSGALFGLIMVFPYLWCVAGTRERHQPAAEETHAHPSVAEQFRLALTNRPFLYVVGVFLCSWMALQITQNIIGFYLTFYLKRFDLFPAVLLAVQGTAMVFLFVWSAVSRKVGRKVTYYLGMSIWIAAQAGLFFLRPDQVNLALVMAALAGIGVATAYLVPWSMLPDVVDLDELNTGERREGIFYGVMTFTQQSCVGMGIALSLKALEYAGFNEKLLPGQQPESALMALRWMIGPVPTVLLVLGMVMVHLYPITRKRHNEILEQLAARKVGQAAEG